MLKKNKIPYVFLITTVILFLFALMNNNLHSFCQDVLPKNIDVADLMEKKRTVETVITGGMAVLIVISFVKKLVKIAITLGVCLIAYNSLKKYA